MNKQFLPLLLSLAIANVYADQSISYTYNSNGQVATMDGPRTDVSDITQYQYNASGQLSKQINAVGHTTTYNSYDKSGNPSMVTDANGIVTTFTYTPEGWLASGITAGAKTSYIYDAIGQVTKVTLPDNSSLSYQWDDAKRLISITNNLKESMTYRYDAMGNSIEETVKKGTTITQQVKRQFDELGRLKTLIKANNKMYEFTYGNHNSPLSVKSPNGNTDSYTYDGINRLTRIYNSNTKEYDEYRYDLANNTTFARGKGASATTYSYDKTNNQTLENSPARKTINYEYDEAGNLIKETNARGNITQYRYDAVNRLIQQIYPNKPDNNVTFTYDQPVTGFYNVGQLTNVKDKAGTTDYNYNNLGLLAQQKIQLTLDGKPLGSQQITNYTYDNVGRILSADYGTLSLKYTRNAGGQVTSLTMSKAGKNTVLANTITYAPFASYITGLKWGNGLVLSRQYDLDGQLIQQKTGTVTTNYQYDLNGNITQIADSQFGTTNYQYDAFNRLIKEQGKTSADYSYDLAGNRLTKNNASGLQELNYYESNVINSYYNKWYITSDAMGNLVTTDNKRTGNYTQYQYDESNRFSEVIKVNGSSQTLLAKYIHNAFGERTIKVKADGSISTFMYNDQGQLVQEAQFNASRQKQKEIYWVWLDTLPIAQIEIPFVNNSQGSQTITYLHGDHLNTPRWATNASKQVVWSWQSDAHGATMANEDPRNTGVKTDIPLRFPGQYFDQETGFHYNYFRTYIPDLGRYSQSDPIGLEGGWNTFAYVEGNSINLVDYYGLNKYGGNTGSGGNKERGQEAKNPVPGKKCVPWPGKPNRMKCRDNQTGKWDKAPRPIPDGWKSDGGKIVPDPYTRNPDIGRDPNLSRCRDNPWGNGDSSDSENNPNTSIGITVPPIILPIPVPIY
ncbi:sugar-binding protein [Gammaproteobacteria bacterium ESL0073]|nr:sugar-binding protein [Gammaproteobacteria bacterium ESL0073]